MQTAPGTKERRAAPRPEGLFSSSEETGPGRTESPLPRKNSVDPKKFFAELQRRNVYKVAVAYGVVGWLLVQVATQLFPVFEIPNWGARIVVVIVLLGFPVALILAWIYELTPEGLQRTDEVPPHESVARSTGRKLDFVIIGVLLAVIAVMGFQHYRPAKSAVGGVGEKSIVILPFLDLSQAKDQEYFSDGITEQIINSLAQVRGLLVVARTTAFSFKNKNLDIREVGRQLGASHVLEGSVSYGPGKVRVVAQLIDVANGFNLWSETYDSTNPDFLSLQSDVAKKVASALQIELHLAETNHLAKALTQNPEAYDFYLRGRYLLNKRTVDSIQKGRALFEQAVTKDPRFALGHAGIADAWILLGTYGELSPEEASRLAWPEVRAALAIDDSLAEGYVSRAMLLADFEWDSVAAEADFRKAIELNPNNAGARHWYAMSLAKLGRFEEAREQILVAQKQDPLSPIIRAAQAKVHFVARQYDEAINQCRAALDLETNFEPAFYILAQAYASKRQFPEAVEAAKKFAELSGDSEKTNLVLAYVYAAAGMKDKAETIVRAALMPNTDFSRYEMATVCAASHDVEGALEWLGKAIERRSLLAGWLRVDPKLDNLRSDPRYNNLASKLVPHQQGGK
jgi:adenylate cyclase